MWFSFENFLGVDGEVKFLFVWIVIFGWLVKLVFLLGFLFLEIMVVVVFIVLFFWVKIKDELGLL